MKMPDNIESAMLAPCGMNCLICYKHCNSKKACSGCLENDKGKPEHCRKCAIKDCVAEHGITRCYECYGFPCARIRAMEKSYLARYGISLIENGTAASREGVAAFMKDQLAVWTCPDCGGVISLHDALCSECKTPR